ncbi:YndJ family protein [Halobacillus sp. ACCC02827]|uniref:YndJ family protein n=1 Tax=Halobacillus sp. ACCC02827 TaxID=3052090 RepID=UPI0025703782|nr:YndJ family protein [Halobacillus sp. ACCC02827]WJE17235.1 YndJ family protein [Halobacillus sp. ACCC02827]
MKPWLVVSTLLFLLAAFFSADPWYYSILTAAQMIYVPLLLSNRRPEEGKSPLLLYGAGTAVVMVAILRLTGDMPWDAALGLLYFIFTILVAFHGVRRMVRRGFTHVEEFFLDVGYVYLGIGGFWFFAFVAEIDTGFYPLLTWLTSIHFHYAGFMLLTFLGLLGRRRKSRSYYTAGWSVVAAPILLALGISFSPILEVASVLLYIVGIYTLIATAWRTSFKNRMQELLCRISFTSLGVTILFSLAYALSQVMDEFVVTIEFMIMFHGVINMVAFGLSGVWGWSLAFPDSMYQVPRFPVSNITGGWRIGEHVLKGKEGGRSCSGLVDDFSIYVSEREEGEVHPEIVSFYEQTDKYRLYSRVCWHWWFYPFAVLYRAVSIVTKQINLPLSRQTYEMTGAIRSVSDNLDGRENTRAWIRKINESEVFIALYASHTSRGQTYMNISLPLPFSAMAGILEVRREREELVLTSEKGNPESDAGTYLIVRGRPIVLPLTEHFRVSHEENGVLCAVHTMRMFGFPFLTIHYRINRKG